MITNINDFKNSINENNINEAKTKDYFIVVKGDDVEFSTTDLKEAKAKFKSYPKPTRPSQEVSLYKLIAQTSI